MFVSKFNYFTVPGVGIVKQCPIKKEWHHLDLKTFKWNLANQQHIQEATYNGMTISPQAAEIRYKYLLSKLPFGSK